MENVRKEQSLEQEDAKPDENGRMGGCAKDRFSKQNPAKDCRTDRVLSSFAGCGGLQCFVPGHGPTTFTRQKCAQDTFQSPKQRTRDQFVDLVETQMMDHVEIKMPKISVQESVEAVEIVPQERISDRMREQIGV